MFENITSTLQQCGVFFILGIIIGICYEPIRFARMLVRHNTVAVCAEDAIFMSLCAVVGFITALSVGIGYFRIYYIVFQLIGSAVYFLTLGRLLNFVFKRCVNTVKRFFITIFKKIYDKIHIFVVPIAVKIRHFFGKIAEIAKNVVFYRKKDLQKVNELLYNKKVQTAVGGENKGVIKAQIRK